MAPKKAELTADTGPALRPCTIPFPLYRSLSESVCETPAESVETNHGACFMPDSVHSSDSCLITTEPGEAVLELCGCIALPKHDCAAPPADDRRPSLGEANLRLRANCHLKQLSMSYSEFEDQD